MRGNRQAFHYKEILKGVSRLSTRQQKMIITVSEFSKAEIIKYYNVKKYAEALNFLAENEDLRKEYGNAGKNRIVTHFLLSDFSNNIRAEEGNVL